MAEVSRMTVRISADTRGFTKGIDGVTKELAAVGKKAFKATAALGTLAAGAASFAAIKGIKYNAELENMENALTALYKDNKKANKELNKLKKLAKKSPFDLKGLAEADKLLLAMGVDANKATDYVKAIGDATANVGGTTEDLNRVALAVAQISAKGKLSAQEMNQLANNGIPAWQYLGEAMHKSTAELMDMGQKGQLLSKDVMPLLIEQMEKHAPNAMERMNQTFQGQMAQLGETANMVLGDITLPLFKKLENALSDVNDKLNAFQKGLKEGGLKKAIESLFAPIVPENKKVLGLAGELGPRGEILGSQSKFARKMEMAIQQMDWSGIGFALGEGIKTAFQDATKNMNWKEIGKNTALNALDFVTGLMDGMFSMEFIKKLLKDHWIEIAAALGVMILAPEVGIPAAIGVGLAKAISKVPFGKMIVGLIKLLRKAFKPLRTWLGKRWEAIKLGFKETFKGGALQNIMNKVKGWVDGIKGLWDDLLLTLDSALTWLGGWVGNLIDTVVKPATKSLGGFLGTIGSAVAWVGSLFGGGGSEAPTPNKPGAPLYMPPPVDTTHPSFGGGINQFRGGNTFNFNMGPQQFSEKELIRQVNKSAILHGGAF